MMSTCKCGQHPEAEYGEFCPSCIQENCYAILDSFEGNPPEIVKIVDRDDERPEMITVEIPSAVRSWFPASRPEIFEVHQSSILAILPEFPWADALENGKK